MSFAVGRLGDRPDLLAALLWIVLLFAALASLTHAFVREVEGRHAHAAAAGRHPDRDRARQAALQPAVPARCSRWSTVPLFLVLMGGPAAALGRPSSALLALGSLALAACATLIGAVIAQTRGRGALFAGVSFPLLLPVLAAAVSGTRAQWQGGGVGVELRLLAAYAAAVLGASLLALRPPLGGLRCDHGAGPAVRLDRGVAMVAGVPLGAAGAGAGRDHARALLPHPGRLDHGGGARLVDGPQRPLPEAAASIEHDDHAAAAAELGLLFCVVATVRSRRLVITSHTGHFA